MIAIDIDPAKIAMARANAEIYGVADRIDFIVGDFLQIANSGAFDGKADAVFVSPPWGGPDYLASSSNTNGAVPGFRSTYDVDKDVPLGGKRCFDAARRISKNVAYFLPKNSDVSQVSCKSF